MKTPIFQAHGDADYTVRGWRQHHEIGRMLCYRHARLSTALR
jgi:hypothetical protein